MSKWISCAQYNDNTSFLIVMRYTEMWTKRQVIKSDLFRACYLLTDTHNNTQQLHTYNIQMFKHNPRQITMQVNMQISTDINY